MSTRPKLTKRERRRLEQTRNRRWTIIAVTVAAVLLAAFLILPNLKTADPGNIVQITPVTHTVPVSGTSMGEPDAPVKVEVWADFQCSGCLAYSENLEPQVIQTFVETGQVYYTFHVYPFIDGGQGESHDSANAAMCAAAQERFWDYHAMLFANWLGENAGSYTKPRLTTFAEDIGLDMTAFEQCFQENTYADQIQADVEAGDAIGVPPTPGIFVNGVAVLSSLGENYLPTFDDIALAINAALSDQ